MGKKKKKADSGAKPKSPPVKQDSSSEEGNQFGGIPDRDLKKNLGCG